MEIKDILNAQRSFFATNETKDVRFRTDALKRLRLAILRNEDKINEALKKDLGKSRFESYMCETGMVLEEIRYTIKNVRRWSRDKRVSSPLSQFPSKSYIISEPYGSVLVIAPWNYPFMLALQPLVSAIAAGNCAVVKPSEYSPHTSKVISELICELFDPSYVAVVEGGADISEALLCERFDYIFYTGGVSVGRIVMQKAAENLTPVTLELGGKSPCIVDETADIELAAKRIVFGKLLNAGQTCVAPDYLIVQSGIREKLLLAIRKYITGFLGSSPLENKDYPRIITKRHFDRIIDMIKDESICIGGGYNADTLKIEPTIIDRASLDSPAMSEEIFGPVLPIVYFDRIEEAIDIVQRGEKPLALYLFTCDRSNERRVLESISFGGGCVNDTVIHLASNLLPFGGVGTSGIGAYHGKYGFDTFTHKKSIVKKSNLIDLPIRYHAYSDKKLRLVRAFLR